ncbi:hypothetical protein CaCOL14_010898 [Colletotrichum acutatum]
MLCSLALPTLLLANFASATKSIFGRRDLLVSDNVKCACTGLSSHSPNSTLFSNSTAYETQRINVWDKRANLHPACIYLPSTAEDVAKGVDILSTCNAQFAVKGGGHMNYPGANTIDDGVLVALNGLNTVTVNNDENTVDVGPGNKWVDVYSALAPYGKYAIGGRLKTIGVPGLTLIGGVSYFLNKYGFSMDNVVKYDVVLGNGTQVSATNTSNLDLFWALKGGASNFGIVTKFSLKTLDLPLATSTYQIFNESATQAFIKAAADFALSDDNSEGAGAVININYNVTTKEVVPQVFGLQETTVSPPSHFVNFTAIPAVSRSHNVTRPIDWHSQMLSPNQMFRIQFGHQTIIPDADRLYEIYQAWVEAITDIADIEGVRPTFILNTVPRTALAVGKNNGIGNTFGLDAGQSYVWWQITTSWARPEDDLRMTAWSQNFLAHHHEINRQLGLATEFVYMGDAGEWQKPFPAYGQGNLQKMKDIRAQYDPNMVFSKLNWGGFKLGH